MKGKVILLLNDEKIKDILEEYKEQDEEFGYYFYGVITATFGKMMALGYLASLAHTYYVVQFTNKKIDLVKLDMIGNPEDHYSISISDVYSIRISNWLFGMGKKIYIELKEGQKIKLKANKFVLGIKEQKQNLLNIEKYLQEINLVG